MTVSQFQFIVELSQKFQCYSQLSVDITEYLASLFALESDYGNSPLAKDFHNYCGMKTPIVRISTALNAGKVSSKDYWARYFDLDDCVFDFLLCLNYHGPRSYDLDTIPHLQHFLNWYCPDRDYANRVMSVYQSYCNYVESLN